jgi:hypothetical protein
MSGLDANGTITVLKYSLSNTQDLFTQLQQLLGTQSGSIDNAKILAAKKVDLQNELTDLTAKVDTLNTEFNDRSAEQAQSKAEAIGIVSRQDWIFLIFFASYALLCLVILTYACIYSVKKVQAVLMVILFSMVIGIMITGVLKYYA